MPSRLSGIQKLESVIDDVVASYQGTEVINNLESAALPNKRAVVAALNHIKPVIYMGFYSTRALTPANLRYAVSEHLYPAGEALAEQIHRAATYEEGVGRCAVHAPGWAEEVVLQLFAELPRLRRVLNADVLAAFEGDPAASSIEEIVFSYPSIEAITSHRIAHALERMGVPIIPRIIAYYAHERTGVDIHPGATIGEGFFMDHGTGVVIGETAVIGKNVKLYQGVTLGALSTRRAEDPGPLPKKRHPTIEDNVTVYSGATILGGDTVIGAGSVIGGNVWLVKSVPPGSKIFGRAKESEEERIAPSAGVSPSVAMGASKPAAKG
jgi:serine O-acetyltransferase